MCVCVAQQIHTDRGMYMFWGLVIHKIDSHRSGVRAICLLSDCVLVCEPQWCEAGSGGVSNAHLGWLPSQGLLNSACVLLTNMYQQLSDLFKSSLSPSLPRQGWGFKRSRLDVHVMTYCCDSKKFYETRAARCSCLLYFELLLHIREAGTCAT